MGELVENRLTMKKIFVFLSAGLYLYSAVEAQEYKLRQVTIMKDTKMESTVYVKGKRQRTETMMAGMPYSITVIEQCDLRRTIKLNDKKKLYYVEPFAIAKLEPPKKEKDVYPAREDKEVKKGGVITIWQSIRDTGERKKMFGFTARHIWTSQLIKPSADACYMKDSMLRKTDGWYIDLPQFECDRGYTPLMRSDGGGAKPDCQDRYVMHNSGKGKLGFPLVEKTTVVMGDERSEFETSLETLELTTTKLDTLLFTIPSGYQRVMKEQDLFDVRDMADMMKGAIEEKEKGEAPVNKEAKAPGKIRIGVFAPTGNSDVQAEALQQHLVNTITNRNVEAIAISSAEEAQKYYCDYTLSTVFTDIKPESTVGGVIKAIRKRDPTVVKSYTVQGTLTLQTVKDGAERSRRVVDGKYEGTIEEAAAKALGQGSLQVLKEIQ